MIKWDVLRLYMYRHNNHINVYTYSFMNTLFLHSPNYFTHCIVISVVADQVRCSEKSPMGKTFNILLQVAVLILLLLSWQVRREIDRKLDEALRANQELITIIHVHNDTVHKEDGFECPTTVEK